MIVKETRQLDQSETEVDTEQREGGSTLTKQFQWDAPKSSERG